MNVFGIEASLRISLKIFFFELNIHTMVSVCGCLRSAKRTNDVSYAPYCVYC